MYSVTIMILVAFILYFFYLFKRGSKQYAHLLMMMLTILLDEETHANQFKQLEAFLKTQKDTDVDQIVSHLFYVYPKAATKDAEIFACAMSGHIKKITDKN